VFEGTNAKRPKFVKQTVTAEKKPQNAMKMNLIHLKPAGKLS